MSQDTESAAPARQGDLTSPSAGAPLSGDLTQGPLFKTLVLFSLPVLLGNVLQSLNSSVNTIWIGRLLGEDALAATSSSNIVMFLVFAAIFGISMATTVNIGRHFGARDLPAMRSSFGAGLGLCLMLSVAIGVIGWLLAAPLLDLLDLPGSSRGFALDYLKVIFLILPAMTLTILVASAMRGCGDSKTPLYFQILTVVLDIALNPLFIAGIGPFPKLGIVGAAVATAIATLAGLAGLLVWIYWRDLPLRLKGRELLLLWPRREEFMFLITKGVPMGFQMVVISGAGVIMIRLINREGLNFAAGYGALLQLWNYLQMPALAISAAVSAMVSQHIGARREGRVDAISLAGIGANLAITAVLTAVMLLLGRPLLGLFMGADSPAIPVALHIQSLAIWTYLPFGVMIVLFGTLRSYGVVFAQIGVLFFTMYGVRLGAYALLYPAVGSDALWYSLLLSSLGSMLLTMALYRYGSWRGLRGAPKAPAR